jgi:hypothetical protein
MLHMDRQTQQCKWAFLQGLGLKAHCTFGLYLLNCCEFSSTFKMFLFVTVHNQVINIFLSVFGNNATEVDDSYFLFWNVQGDEDYRTLTVNFSASPVLVFYIPIF